MWHRTLIRLFSATVFVGCGREVLDFPALEGTLTLTPEAGVTVDAGAGSDGAADACAATVCTVLPLVIAADVDGFTDLVLKGGTLRWHHTKYEVPANTTINGVRWTPEWPTPSKSCDCDSTALTLSPPLPPREQEVQVAQEAGRIPVKVEQPTAANDFTLTVRFQDAPSSVDSYRIRIDYSP